MQIRNVVSTDLEKIQSYHKEEFGFEIKGNLEMKYNFVLEKDGEFIGFILGGIIQIFDPLYTPFCVQDNLMFILNSLFIRKEFRRNGYAKLLLVYFLSKLKVKYTGLFVKTDNEAAKNLYEQFEFKPVHYLENDIFMIRKNKLI